MDRFVINGGSRIEGEIKVDGAKNSVLPILAATIINGGESIVHNVPDLKDVETLTGVLKTIGCKCFYENNTIMVKSDNLMDINIPEKPVREMRSSIILLGAMIARTGQAKISYPGGYDSIVTKLTIINLIALCFWNKLLPLCFNCIRSLALTNNPLYKAIRFL